MRIIKEGKVPEVIEKEGACSYCKTIFAYTKADVHTDPRDGPRDGDFVECPVCKKLLSASVNDFLTGNFEGK